MGEIEFVQDTDISPQVAAGVAARQRGGEGGKGGEDKEKGEGEKKKEEFSFENVSGRCQRAKQQFKKKKTRRGGKSCKGQTVSTTQDDFISDAKEVTGFGREGCVCKHTDLCGFTFLGGGGGGGGKKI